MLKTLSFNFHMPKDGLVGTMQCLYPTETVRSPAFTAYFEDESDPQRNFSVEGVIVDFAAIECKRLLYANNVNPRRIHLSTIDNKLQRVWDMLKDEQIYDRIRSASEALETVREEYSRMERLLLALQRSYEALQKENTVVTD